MTGRATYAGGRGVVYRDLDGLRTAGVHHVILNFKYARRNVAEILAEFGREILPQLAADRPAVPVAAVHAV